MGLLDIVTSYNPIGLQFIFNHDIIDILKTDDKIDNVKELGFFLE